MTAILPVIGLAGRCEGDSMAVPTFATNRLMGAVPSFPPAISPWVRRRLSP